MTINSDSQQNSHFAASVRVLAVVGAASLTTGLLASAPAQALSAASDVSISGIANGPRPLQPPASRKAKPKAKKKIRVAARAGVTIKRLRMSKGHLIASVNWDSRLTGALQGKSRYSVRVLTYQGKLSNPTAVKKVAATTRFVDQPFGTSVQHNRQASRISVPIKKSKRAVVRNSKIAVAFTQVHDTNGKGGWDRYALNTVHLTSGIKGSIGAKQLAKMSRSSTNFLPSRLVSRAKVSKQPRLIQAGFGGDFAAFSCPGWQNDPIDFVISGAMPGQQFQCQNLTEVTVSRGAPGTPGVSLANTDFAGADLYGVNLGYVNLSGSTFATENWNSMQTGPATVQGLVLSCAKLVHANLSGIAGQLQADCADLNSANLSGANLSGSDFTAASMQSANLTGANLSWCAVTLPTWNNCGVQPGAQQQSVTMLYSAVLAGADLTNANLTNAVTNNFGAQVPTYSAVWYMPVVNGVNLSGATLTGVQLAGLDFSNVYYPISPPPGVSPATGPANFAGTDLTQLVSPGLANANLSGVNFTGANLTGMQLGTANLDWTIFIKATLANATFINATLTNTIFGLKSGDCSTTLDTSQLTQSGVTLSGVYLGYCDLQGLDFSNSPMPGAFLEGANLDGAVLSTTTTQTNHSGIDLSNATVTGVNLQGATLTGASFANATLNSGTLLGQAILTNADFTSAQAPSVFFGSVASLSNTNFTSTTLTGAGFNGLQAQPTPPNFQNAHLQGANFTLANLTGSSFSGADFAGATLTGTNLNQGTPSGLNNQAACDGTTWYDGTQKTGACTP